MSSSRPGVHLIQIALKPGDKPPARTVTCSQCSHWAGRERRGSGVIDVGERCSMLGCLTTADFGCAYFQRRPEHG